MGRRPKSAPKGAPLGRTAPLTVKQFHLLSWVYVKGYQTAADIHITWSPKAFLGRSPTKTEAAVLSRRVKGLVNDGLLRRHGRELTITDAGKTELAIYSLGHNGHPLYDNLLARLDFDSAAFDLGFFNQLRPVLVAVYRDEIGLEQDDAVDAAHTLFMAITRYNVKRARRALERLQETQRRVRETT